MLSVSFAKGQTLERSLISQLHLLDKAGSRVAWVHEMNSYLSSYKVTRGSPSGANHLRKQRPRPSYLQDVLPLGVLLASQPPLFEEAAQLEAEQQQSLLEVLGLLH